MANAKEIKSRIGQLEADLAKQSKATAAAEAALADAYANGKPTDAPMEALWKARSAEDTMTRVLSTLDVKWYAVAVEEYEAALKAINDESEAAYTEARGAIEAAISSGLVPVLTKRGIPAGGDLLASFSEGVLELAWQIFSARAADKQRALGQRPSAPLPRNAAGVPAAEGRV